MRGLRSSKIRGRVATKILRAVFGIYLAMAVVFAALQFLGEYAIVKKYVSESIMIASMNSKEAIELNLWSANKSGLIEELDGLLAFSEISAAIVIDGSDHYYAGVDRYGSGSSLSEVDRSDMVSIELQKVDQGKVLHLGRLEVYVESGVIWDRLKVGYLILLLDTILKTVGLWFILVWGIKTTLSEPFERFARQAKEVSLTNLKKVDVEEESLGDELEELKYAFNEMILNLRKSLDEKVESERMISALNEQLGAQLHELDSRNEELMKNKAELRLILDTIPAYIWYKDDKNNILRVNKAGADSVNLKVDELEGVPTGSVFPEDAEAYYADDLKVIRSGIPKLGYIESYTPVGGTEHWIRTDKIPFKDSSTGVNGVLAVVTDVTENVTQQGVIKDGEERFKLAVEGASVGVWVDVGAKGEWWSNKFYELLGFEDGEFLASVEAFGDLLHPDDRESALNAIGDAFKGQGDFSIEIRLKTKDRGYRYFATFAAVLLDENSQAKRMVASIQDIDDRYKAAEKIEEANRELAKANKELTNFAYITSHDLREPLRSISSFMTLLRDDYGDSLDKDANDYIEFALEGSLRLQAMIQSLLSYSRIDQPGPLREPFSLRSSAIVAAREVSVLIDETGTKIHMPSNSPEIIGDQNQVTQVFQNLITNSIKFKSEESPVIYIEFNIVRGSDISSELNPDINYCLTTIRDNGIGIDPAYHKKIFSIFQRLHSLSEYEGNGIGLSLSQKIVNIHGGIIWVESTEGTGSSFKFALPVIDNKSN